MPCCIDDDDPMEKIAMELGPRDGNKGL